MTLPLLGQAAPAAPASGTPTVTCKIAFASDPLDPNPTYTDVSDYLRSFTISRGRSFEYDRIEAGTATVVLDNRDGRFNPDNTGSPYYPNLKPTRRIKLEATWGAVYPLFAGFTEGYPQQFPYSGADAAVALNATDWFYPLSRLKFPTGTLYPEQLSGTRIQACLSTAGIAAADTSIDAGQSLIEEATEVEGSILEHCQLVAEAENGRFYAAADGKLTFLDRHAILGSELTSRGTLGSATLPFTPDAATVTQDESKLYNVVRITTPDGTVTEASDATSITDHFERTLEKTWPLASTVEAESAATFMVSRLKDATTRVPSAVLVPVSAPTTLWPVALGAEIGQRYTYQLDPITTGPTISKAVVIDGVQHDATPANWRVTLRLVLANTNVYWKLGVAGQSELGTTTVLAY